MKILLFGATGQLGHELIRTLTSLGTVVPTHRSEALFRTPELPWIKCDLLDERAVRTAIVETQPELIVNAAAYTAVDRAETDVDIAHQANAVAPGVMAAAAAQIKAPLIHFSTDYVYDGGGSTPYEESHQTAPVSVYGQTKLQGEQAIQAVDNPHLIFRTAWVYGARGQNFLRTMLRLAQERDRLSVVNDQHGSPVWSRLLAEMTATIVSRLSCPESVGNFNRDTGLYHLSAAGQTTWYGFACELLGQAHALGLIERMPDIRSVGTDAYPTPAIRPAYSVLDNGLVEKVFGIAVPSWQVGLNLCLADMVNVQ